VVEVLLLVHLMAVEAEVLEDIEHLTIVKLLEVEVLVKQQKHSHQEQNIPSQLVLVELDNKGSRTIEDINLHIRFVDSNGIEVDRSIFNRDSLSAHTSVAGDDLELLVNGTSVWENYTIEILLNYEYYGGDRSERWTHDVGGWTMEIFVDKSPYRFL